MEKFEYKKHLKQAPAEDDIPDIPVSMPEVQRISGKDEEKILRLLESLKENDNALSLDSVERIFTHPDFYSALPEDIKNSEEELCEYMRNTGAFDEIIHTERKRRWAGDSQGLLGEEAVVESVRADGSSRRAEKGYRVNLDVLRERGIDPSKVLFFRRTDPQSGDVPKPERFWTSDFSEVADGLRAEVRGDRRKNSVVLVADLQTIASEGGGLIEDINDDSGMSVTQIETKPFDYQKVLLTLGNVSRFE